MAGEERERARSVTPALGLAVACLRHGRSRRDSKRDKHETKKLVPEWDSERERRKKVLKRRRSFTVGRVCEEIRVCVLRGGEVVLDNRPVRQLNAFMISIKAQKVRHINPAHRDNLHLNPVGDQGSTLC